MPEKYPLPHSPLKCSVTVSAGIIIDKAEVTRNWNFTAADLERVEHSSNTYVDQMGAAMNYAMSLQNPNKYNWVKFEWLWL